MESRKHLSATGLLTLIHDKFAKINAPRMIAKRSEIELVDCLMSGLAMFSMKSPSLLQFEEQANKSNLIKRNIRTLYKVNQVPSDTYLRERLDEIDPREVRKVFKCVFAQVQRGKALEEYAYLDGHYLMPMDMTGFFSSSTIRCQNCCVKKHNKPKMVFLDQIPKDIALFDKNTYLFCRNNIYLSWELFYIDEESEMQSIDITMPTALKGDLFGKKRKDFSAKHTKQIKEIITAYHESQFNNGVTYYHNMMCAAIVHPDKKLVIPLAPEPVLKKDGSTKNDCELNSAKRLIADVRREHPHLKLIAVQDALGANYPNLLELKFADIRFIVGVKPDNHKELFSLVKTDACQEYRHETSDGKSHRYRYINDVPLNRNACFNINFIEYWQTDKNGVVKHFSWVTDIPINNENIYQLMRGGRASWKIENHTFNTLKNQGYHFSHNFGHGYQHLSSNFGMLLMLAFLVDQVQELCCELFKKARAQYRTRIGLWTKMKSLFHEHIIASWDDVYNAIAYGRVETSLIPNTS